MRSRALLSGVLFLLSACASNHPGVYAGHTAGSVFGSAIRVNGRRSADAIGWGGLLGAGLGFVGESLVDLVSGEEDYGRSYVVRMPYPNPRIAESFFK